MNNINKMKTAGVCVCLCLMASGVQAQEAAAADTLARKERAAVDMPYKVRGKVIDSATGKGFGRRATFRAGGEDLSHDRRGRKL